jgi:hypothetical protein
MFGFNRKDFHCIGCSLMSLRIVFPRRRSRIEARERNASGASIEINPGSTEAPLAALRKPNL